MREELIEALSVANCNEEAGDLLAEAGTGDAESMSKAFDLYVRGNCWQKAINFAHRSGQTEKIEAVLKPALMIAVDLKANQLRQTIDTFGKRMLRLKIV